MSLNVSSIDAKHPCGVNGDGSFMLANPKGVTVDNLTAGNFVECPIAAGLSPNGFTIARLYANAVLFMEKANACDIGNFKCTGLLYSERDGYKGGVVQIYTNLTFAGLNPKGKCSIDICYQDRGNDLVPAISTCAELDKQYQGPSKDFFICTTLFNKASTLNVNLISFSLVVLVASMFIQ
ncbi:hypothetical protein HDU97_001429 [Phlyctochytrium planicorne]|nr:hypothetical protein HDU97_001429 [Phlyctochytrium planicorne]